MTNVVYLIRKGFQTFFFLGVALCERFLQLFIVVFVLLDLLIHVGVSEHVGAVVVQVIGGNGTGAPNMFFYQESLSLVLTHATVFKT